MSVLPVPAAAAGYSEPIARLCYRCDGQLLTASTQPRVYCPSCVVWWDCPTPVEPALASPVRRVASASSSPHRRMVTAPVRPRCTVCHVRVRPGQECCLSCADQLPLFSAQVDRRRREWRS